MKESLYNIEDNVPIPERKGKWSQLAAAMKEGDSVLVKGRIEAMNMRNAIVRLGFKAVTRGNDKPQTRVWKVTK